MNSIAANIVGRALWRVASFLEHPADHVVRLLVSAQNRAVAGVRRVSLAVRRDELPCILCGSPGGTHAYQLDSGACSEAFGRLVYVDRLAEEPRLRAELARREERGAA